MDTQIVMNSPYKILELLGNGNYGKVYKAINCHTNQIVAIKEVKKFNTNEGVDISFVRELSIHRKVSHPNIIKQNLILFRLIDFEIKQSNQFAYFVLEYMESDLQKEIKKNINGFSLERIKSIIKQILDALNCLRKKSIMHRDLKPSNILINPLTDKVKLSDFGLSKQVMSSSLEHTHKVSPLFYRAPEIFLTRGIYGIEVDMWSLGCVMAELILGTPLMLCANPSQISTISCIAKNLSVDSRYVQNMCFGIEQGRIQYQNTQLTTKLCVQGLNFLNGLLQLNPKQRMTPSQALNHPFLKQNQLVNQIMSDVGFETEEESIEHCFLKIQSI